ncbi:MAG: MBL fold metallo-hydrolase [Gammaproteobacteria bacterium]|nr:MAG: MBL fold metallo-hydrolase [Gammaproteobacteria bacterium]
MMQPGQVENALIVEQIQLGPMENFVYIVGSTETREVALVDPAWDIDALLNLLDEKDYKLTAALVTHYHPDHIGGSFSGNAISGLAELMEQRPVKVYAHKSEAEGVRKVTGISESDIVKVDSGDTLRLGEIEVEFLHTPGHTPGSQCFRIKNTLVSGDTLFIQGCGRVDLPGSNVEDMYHSLKKLAALPDDTLLLPGHHYSTAPNATMGETKAHNPYLRIDDLATWRNIMG